MTADPPVVELDVIEGLADVARDEVVERLGVDVPPVAPDDRALAFAWDGDIEPVLALRTALSASWRLDYESRRPSAILGDTRLADVLDRVVALHPRGTFRSFGIDAPGKRSAAMTRVRDFVAAHTGLEFVQVHAQVLLRVRRGPGNRWEVLVRLTPRPLSARPWRVRSPQGAVNACLAAAIVRLLEPSSRDCFVNLMCGSATLLVERVAASPTRSAVGIDISPDMLGAARANVAAAGVDDRCTILLGDACHLPLRDGSADEASVVLPYGFRVGSHETNEQLYPVLLDETARVLRAGGRLAVLTQELGLFESCLATARHWDVVDHRRVWQGGHRPGLYVLARRRPGVG